MDASLRYNVMSKGCEVDFSYSSMAAQYTAEKYTKPEKYKQRVTLMNE